MEPPTSSGFVEATKPSVRSGSGVVYSSSVGRFGMCLMPVRGGRGAALLRKARAGEEADGQVGARADEMQGVETELVEPGAACQISSMRASQAATGSGSSSRQT